MTDTKWTPGRWIEGLWSRRESQVVAVDDDGMKHLICAGVLTADAHLIAAAPELYEALLYAQGLLAQEDMGHDDIDNALAKARGETHG